VGGARLVEDEVKAVENIQSALMKIHWVLLGRNSRLLGVVTSVLTVVAVVKIPLLKQYEVRAPRALSGSAK
jgi:hypothetical protein